jgi:hypothetical protein
MTMFDLAIDKPTSPHLSTNAATGRALEETIAVLAELFPAAFVAERRRP